MVRKLGPIMLLMLMGGHALAQQPPSVTVRLSSGVRLHPITRDNLAWIAVPPAPPTRPEPAPSAAGPVELLLSLAEAL